MGPSKNKRTISQEAFEGLVKENIDDLVMDPAEALQDAIETLTLQGVDLSVLQALLLAFLVLLVLTTIRSSSVWIDSRNSKFDSKLVDDKDVEQLVKLFEKLSDLCSGEEPGNASIAVRNGGLDLVILLCSKIKDQCQDEKLLVSALKALSSLIHDLQGSEIFRKNDGPRVLMDILNDNSKNVTILNSGFSVVSAAATGNEVVKESFMDLKVDELLVQLLNGKNIDGIQHPYDAIRVLLTADDARVLASQVYGYARRFAKIGIVAALVNALHAGISSPNLISASIALRAVAVNDEICRSIADHGGIDAVLQCIDDSGEQMNKTVARVLCSLLCKLAGSDANKSSIVQKRGLDRLITLSCRFNEDPSVLQEIMTIICTLSLRSPSNAASAVEAGAGDFAIQAMQKFPAAQQMQKQSCLMIRNLVVRNPENRTILLGNGIEKIIRKAKENHESCRDAATGALRDLGLDNYNT